MVFEQNALGRRRDSRDGRRTVIYRRRLTMPCLLVIAVLSGTAVVSRAGTGDPPASVPGPQPFDVGAATNVLGDATLEEAAPAPPFVGLATRVTVDPLFGTATTTIPIELPPARLTPDVTIRYSSNGGSGPFALGWALALGSVTRNSANGVPLAYDSSGA
jgi:Salmonella virulence plasmid 65kDa B protein